MRVTFKVFLVVLIVFMGCNQGRYKKTEKRKPNIIFILADDLGYSDLGITGSKYYETPHIDKIANESVNFTQGYSSSRICSPSRASIMTGQFTARHGVTDWIGAKSGEQWRENKRYDKLLPAEYKNYLSRDFVTLPEALKEEGYKTFIAGKWHIGEKGSLPKDHGFDVEKGRYRRGGSSSRFYYSPFDVFHLEDNKLGENLSMRLARNGSVHYRSERFSIFCLPFILCRTCSNSNDRTKMEKVQR